MAAEAGERVGCVVCVSEPGGAGETAGSAGRGPWSGSGVLLARSPGLVLCHGLIFSPFLLAPPCSDWPPRAALLADSFSPAMRIRVLGPGSDSRGRAGLRRRQQQGGVPALRVNPLSGGLEPVPGGLESHEAALLMLLPCRPFQEAFPRVFGASDQWRFGEGEEEAGASADPPRFLHWFALLRLLDGGGPRGARAVSWAPAALLRKGDPLLACGSPFGSFCPDIFMNTLSKGVVSNLAGEGNALILTDARCLPGTEGGGVFALREGRPRLVGIIVAPLCWKSHEWVGLTLVCAVDGILETLRDLLSAPPRRFPKSWFPPLGLVWKAQETAIAGDGPVRQMLAAVVLVECGLPWGSGVMVSPRLVLTCRHVVSGASSVRVRLGASPEQ